MVPVFCVGAGCAAVGGDREHIAIDRVRDLVRLSTPWTLYASVEDGGLEEVMKALGGTPEAPVPSDVRLDIRSASDGSSAASVRRLLNATPVPVPNWGIRATPIGIQGMVVLAILIFGVLLMYSCLSSVQGPSQFNTKRLPFARRDFG
jgi:hypothetical protein